MLNVRIIHNVIIDMFCSDSSVVQSTLTHTFINSAITGVRIEGLAPVLDHLTITGSDTGVDYRPQGWGLLTMLECNISHNSHTQLLVASDSADAAIYLYRYLDDFL